MIRPLHYENRHDEAPDGGSTAQRVGLGEPYQFHLKVRACQMPKGGVSGEYRYGFPLPLWKREQRRCFSFGLLLLTSLLVSTQSMADIARGNPAARLLSSESASEHWEFTARFDSGHYFFAEFLITNIGPGERNAAAIGYIIDPGGTPHRFTNGRRNGHWNLSPDHLSLHLSAPRQQEDGPCAFTFSP